MNIDELIVVKRSGQRVNFNSYKIVVAIKQAFDSVYKEENEKGINKVYEHVLKYIEDTYQDRKTINVEDIQDIIETKLRDEKYLEVYKSFSEYRQKRAASRQIFKIKQQHKFIKALEKILEDDSLKTDNDYKASDLIKKYGKTIVKEFNKSYVIDNKFLRAHDEGYIFINDLNCFSLGIFSSTHLKLNEYLKNDNVDYDLLLHLNNLKKEVNGSLSIPAIDYLFEEYFLNNYKSLFKEILKNNLKIMGFKPYVNLSKFEDIIDKETSIKINIDEYERYILSDVVKNIILSSSASALEEAKGKTSLIIKNMFNGLSNIGDTSVSFGTNNTEIGNLIIEIIFNILKEPFNLEIIFKLNDESIKYLPNVYESLKTQKKLLISFNSSFNQDDEEVEYFGSGIRVFENNNNDLRSSIGRLVVSSVSLNLSRLALETKDKNIKEFYEKLDIYLELVKNCLLLIFESIGSKTKANYNYLFQNNIFDDEKLEENQRIRKVIKNGVLLIGITGLKEAVYVLEKDSLKQEELLLKILTYLNKKCTLFEEESKLNIQIYEPSEKDARKHFMALDKSVFGIIKNVTSDFEYGLVSDFKKDYAYLSKVQKEFIAGMKINVSLANNITYEKFATQVKKIKAADVGFVSFNITDN